MNETSSNRLRAGRAASIGLRLGLGYLTVSEILIGFWQSFLPRSFYDGFPLPGRHWVSSLPGYNEHIIRDLGGLNLGMGFMLAVAAVTLSRLLVRTTLTGYLLFSISHLIFHLGHLDPFPMVDRVGQVAGLAISVVLPLLLLYASRVDRGRQEGAARREPPVGPVAESAG